MVSLYLALFALTTLVELVCAKGCSNAIERGGRRGYALFMFLNGVVSCLFFATVSGFRLTVTPITLLFSLLFAAAVLVSLLATLCAYTIADIANVSVINSACTLLVTTGVGSLLFHEAFGWSKAVRVVLMLSATVLVFLDTRRRKKAAHATAKGALLKLSGLLGLLILANGSSTILLKYFTQTPGVASENDFFFFTNVILIVVSALWFLCEQRRDRVPFAACFQDVRPLHLLCYAGRTVSSNAAALMTVALLALMDVSLYTPLSGALAILCGIAASLLFREKVGPLALLAAALAIGAVVM